MSNARLLSTVAASLLLSAGLASAQSPGTQAPSRPPAAQQNAPAEKMSPPLHSGERSGSNKGSETTGQAPQSRERSGGPAADQSPATGHPQRSEKRGGEKSGTTGQSPNSQAGEQRRGEKNEHRANDERNERRTNNGANSSGGAMERPAERSRGTTGQGAAAGAARLSTEQRTRITTIIRRQKVQPTRLNVSVRVGTRVPDSVRFYPLPTSVIEVYPEWRGYNYILVGEQIVIIDPRTHEIVAVLEA